MIEKYFLFLVVVFQSNADNKERYIVDSNYNQYYGQSRHYNLNNLAVTQNPYRYQDYYKIYSDQSQKVKIQLYYETLCPDCRSFDSGAFKDTVLSLGSYLDIHVYPYGNAQTKEHNGHVEITCQHGPAECYGNKLHACAIDYLQNITAAVLYNSCMMDSTQAGQGSDDAAANVCAQAMGINPNPIKQCAKDDRGTALLKYYGVESKKVGFNYVPYILIDGVPNNGDNFKRDVCKAFRNPPPACNGYLY